MEILGRGIYTIPEACRYLDAHPSRVYRWFNENGVFTSDYNEIDGQRALSFLDLMDAKVALTFRNSNVPMPELRNAYNALREQTGRPHPFAHNDLYLHDGKIFRKEIRPDKTPLLYRVSTREGYIEEVMRPFLTRVEFDKQSHQALRWHIADGILMDPAIRFGAPVIEHTRIPAEILMQCYQAHDGDAQAVSDMYEITAEQVRNSVKFFRTLGLAA